MDISIFETVMMVCFGFSWPFAILKTIRTKNPAGKSLGFSVLVLIGYFAGILYKYLGRFDYVFFLYVINFLMVGTVLVLTLYYARMLQIRQLTVARAVAAGDR